MPNATLQYNFQSLSQSRRRDTIKKISLRNTKTGDFARQHLIFDLKISISRTIFDFLSMLLCSGKWLPLFSIVKSLISQRFIGDKQEKLDYNRNESSIFFFHSNDVNNFNCVSSVQAWVNIPCDMKQLFTILNPTNTVATLLLFLYF